MIEILCLRNNGILGRFISWGTKKKNQNWKKSPSHIGVLFFGRFVLHSTGSKGVHLSTFKYISKEYEILSRFGYTKKINQDEIFKESMHRTIGLKYDYLGVIFLGIRFFLHKYFGKTFSKYNNWQKDNQLFCVEVASYITQTNLSNLSPNDLMYKLRNMENFKRL